MDKRINESFPFNFPCADSHFVMIRANLSMRRIGQNIARSQKNETNVSIICMDDVSTKRSKTKQTLTLSLYPFYPSLSLSLSRSIFFFFW